MLFQFYFKVLVLGEKMRLNQPKTQPLVEIGLGARRNENISNTSKSKQFLWPVAVPVVIGSLTVLRV